jgi:hypothetical protein
MAGKKGMTPSRPRANAVRNKVWQSMRILRRFTAADLSRTSGAGINNVRKFLVKLNRHGYVAPAGNYVGGRAGSMKPWRIVKDCGPDYPMVCDRCGRPLGERCVGEED